MSITVLTTSLAIGEKVAGLFGGSSAARAEAYRQAAMLELLNGTALAIDGIAESLAEIVKMVGSVSEEMKRIILAVADERQHATVTSIYSNFLREKKGMVSTPEVELTERMMEKYVDRLFDLLAKLQDERSRIMHMNRGGRIEPVASICVALKAELDLFSELSLLGYPQPEFLPTLEVYEAYFAELLSADKPSSLPAQLEKLEGNAKQLLSEGAPGWNEFIQMALAEPSRSVIHDRELTLIMPDPPSKGFMIGDKKARYNFEVLQKNIHVKLEPITASQERATLYMVDGSNCKVSTTFGADANGNFDGISNQIWSANAAPDCPNTESTRIGVIYKPPQTTKEAIENDATFYINHGGVFPHHGFDKEITTAFHEVITPFNDASTGRDEIGFRIGAVEAVISASKTCIQIVQDIISSESKIDALIGEAS